MRRVGMRMTIPAEHDGIFDSEGNKHRSGTAPRLIENDAVAFKEKSYTFCSDALPKRKLLQLIDQCKSLEYRDKLSTLRLVFGVVLATVGAIGWFLIKK